MSEITKFLHANNLPAEAAAQLDFYVSTLLEFNEKMNLIGPMSREIIVRELILDSLVPATIWPAASTCIDVGSGAGLPGIPLAIALPDVEFTLVEPRKKRSQFMRIVVNRLGLKNVRIFDKRVEQIPDDDYQCAVSKAVFSPLDFLRILNDWVAENGSFISMCSADSLWELNEYASNNHLRKSAEISDVSKLIGHRSEIQRCVVIWTRD